MQNKNSLPLKDLFLFGGALKQASSDKDQRNHEINQEMNLGIANERNNEILNNILDEKTHEKLENSIRVQNTEVLLIINVDIGKAEMGQIFYHQNDDLEKLAVDFLKKYQLANHLKGVLLSNISEKVQEFHKTSTLKEHKFINDDVYKNIREIPQNYPKNISKIRQNDQFNPKNTPNKGKHLENNLFNSKTAQKVQKMNNFYQYMSEKKPVRKYS